MAQGLPLAAHRAARHSRHRRANPTPSDRAHTGFEPRRHPPERVPSLRRSLTALLELPPSPGTGETHHRRRQLVPRLPRMRLRPRPLRIRSQLATKPLRARAPLQDERRPLSASGPGLPVLRTAIARRREHVRRLPARRRTALSDQRGRSRVDRQQPVPRHRPTRAGLPSAHGDHRRQSRPEPGAAARQSREQHHPHRRTANRRLRRVRYG